MKDDDLRDVRDVHQTVMIRKGASLRKVDKFCSSYIVNPVVAKAAGNQKSANKKLVSMEPVRMEG